MRAFGLNNDARLPLTDAGAAQALINRGVNLDPLEFPSADDSDDDNTEDDMDLDDDEGANKKKKEKKKRKKKSKGEERAQRAGCQDALQVRNSLYSHLHSSS